MSYEPSAIPFVKHASHDGGTTDNYIADYSGTDAVEAVLQPPAGEVWVASRMLVYIEDAGNPDMDTYGNLEALTNGIRFGIKDDNEVLAYLDGEEAVKDNGDWAKLMYDFTQQAWAAVNYYLIGRFTFTKFVPEGIVLHGDDPDNVRLFWTIQDDFEGLVKHEFYIEGYKWRGKGPVSR